MYFTKKNLSISALSPLLIFPVLIGLFTFSAPVSAQKTDNIEMTAGEADDLLRLYFNNGQTESEEIPEESFLDPEDIPPTEYYKARVIEITAERTENIYDSFTEEIQDVRLQIISGPQKGSTISTTYGGIVGVEKYQKVQIGNTMVVIKSYKVDGSYEYYITEHYRIPSLGIILFFFAGLTLFFGRKKGAGSLLGLVFSIAVIALFIVPKIIQGADPLFITLVGTFIIAAVSLFLAHGFNRRTSVAFVSTMITLTLSLGLSEIFVRLAYLFGKGTENAFFLQTGELANLDLRGLLLAGIIIGTLGVLDDITTAQTAVVGELRQANPLLKMKELYNRALVVGREHIASLVNTLVLAYAGTSLPLFLLFSINEGVPLWVKINSELIAEEIIRTIIGSSALILAVPIATLLAAYFLKDEKVMDESISLQ